MDDDGERCVLIGVKRNPFPMSIFGESWYIFLRPRRIHQEYPLSEIYPTTVCSRRITLHFRFAWQPLLSTSVDTSSRVYLVSRLGATCVCSRSSSTLVSFRFFTDRVFISCSLIIYTDEKVSQRESIKSKSIRACVTRVILKEKKKEEGIYI